jgi:sugar lactone lactonase YvrE
MKKLFLSSLGFSLCAFFINSVWGQANYLTPYAVTTMAGSPGHSGSADGTNGAASFAIDAVNLCGIAVDTNSGSIYVTDTGNSTIRRLTPVGTNWVVTTIAGQPGVTGSANGTNTTATFNYPVGLTMDASGNLYVLDTLNYLVREISPMGTNWVTKTVAAFAGSPIEWAITCDQNGNLYTVSSSGIQEISPTNNWQVVPIAGNVTFNALRGIAVDTNGNLYVVDALGPDVQELTLSGGNWVDKTIAGMPGVSGYADGTNTSAAFNQPESVAMDNQGNLYVTDSANQTIREIAPVGPNWVVSTLAGISGGTGSADGVGINAGFNYPAGLVLDGHGNFYVGDTGNDTIRMGSVAKLPLAIARFGPNTNLVSWPSAASYLISGGVATATNWIGYPGAGHVLQSNGNLQTTNWANYAGTVTTANGTNSAIITPVTGNLFFRLIQ